MAGPNALATSRGSPRRGQSRGLRRRAPCQQQPLPHPHPERCTPRGRGGMPSPAVAWESSFKGRPLSLFWEGDNAARDPTGRKTRSRIPILCHLQRGIRSPAAQNTYRRTIYTYASCQSRSRASFLVAPQDVFALPTTAPCILLTQLVLLRTRVKRRNASSLAELKGGGLVQRVCL